jgi:adenylate cyclase
MEIERKFLVKDLPEHLDTYPVLTLEQGYLCTDPVLRIRKQDEKYELTYKSKGLLSREEITIPLTKESYEHLLTKIDGNLIRKKRYLIPFSNLTIELDIFEKPFEDYKTAEVEFSTEKDAYSFCPPSWFGEDVTFDPKYKNNYMSTLPLSDKA